MNNKDLILQLKEEHNLPLHAWQTLISTHTAEDAQCAADTAREIAVSHFGNKIFFRGIIEYTNNCRNNCYYCGIRRGNTELSRYRMNLEEILSCCEAGYEWGFRTFVLQGGEDPYYTDEKMVEIISAIHQNYPDCAITLSIGEKERASYQAFFDAGANRYLLRHETATESHYRQMHPAEMILSHRLKCLEDLKDIGYQTGCGAMIGAPYQTVETLAADMDYMARFKPQMIGMGPFIPHAQTPFRDFPAGSVDLTLFLLSLCRIMLPEVLLPATTALGSLDTDGRKRGVLCGCNVIMPNISPFKNRKKYALYDHKAVTGEDGGEELKVLQAHMEDIGYTLYSVRGDYKA